MYQLQPDVQTAPVQSYGIHIGCPDIICGTAESAVESAGQSVVKSTFSYIANLLFDGVHDGLNSVVHDLLAAPEARLSIPYFVTVYNRTFGLMLFLAVALLLIKAVRLMVNWRDPRKSEQAVAAVANLFRYTAFGIILPMLVAALMVFSAWLSQLAARITMTGSHSTWKGTLLEPYGVADALGALGLRFFMSAFAGLLRIQLNLLQLQIYFAILFTLIAYASDKDTKWGKRFRNVGKSGLVTIIFAKPLMIFWIIFSSEIISIAPQPQSVMATYVLIIEMIAAFIPVTLFVMGMVVFVHLDHIAEIRSEIEGRVYTSPDAVPNARLAADIEQAVQAKRQMVSGDTRRSFRAARNFATDVGLSKAVTYAAKAHPVAGVAAEAAHIFVRSKRKH